MNRIRLFILRLLQIYANIVFAKKKLNRMLQIDGLKFKIAIVQFAIFAVDMFLFKWYKIHNFISASNNYLETVLFASFSFSLIKIFSFRLVWKDSDKNNICDSSLFVCFFFSFKSTTNEIDSFS